MTTTVAFANHKPGTSKTTSAVFLATAFCARGLKTLMVDSDPGRSAVRWQELSGEPFAFDLTAIASKTLYHQLVPLVQRGNWDAVVIDCPQLEDHRVIGVGALRFADHWVVPFKPSGIEVDRTRDVCALLDEVDAGRDTPGKRYALLTRTNRPYRTKTGPDAQMAKIIAKQGYDVIPHNVPNVDGIYCQQFAVGTPDISATPFPAIASYLLGE